MCNCLIHKGKNCCEHIEGCEPADVCNKLNNISALIEDAKLKCKSQYGVGHYSQTAFWNFILAVEKEVGVFYESK